MAKTNAPVKKNEHYTVTFTDLTHEGNGVAKIGGYPIFVPEALPDETAEIRIVKANKKFGFGKLIELKKQSEGRTTPPCPVFYKCGGCQLQHMSYEMQLDMKRSQATNVMHKVAHLPDVPVHPVLGMEDPWHYRNKIQLPVGEKDGEIILGFYQQRSHRIIDDMETCLIQNKTGDKLVQGLRKLLNELGMEAYDEKSHRGVLRHVVLRTAYETNDMMLIFVTKTAKLPNKDALIARITAQYPEVKSIVHNVNPDKTNVILGKKTTTIYGEDHIIDSIGDIKFKISPKSFFQVNPTQTKVLYEKALEYADINEHDVVIDAYCGIGSISLFLAQKAKKVYGVEIVPDAIRDAKENAALNGLTNTEFVVGEAETVMPEWKKAGIEPDVIVVDPPRKGCDETFLQTMLEMDPKRIVYVSCNPSTLARDLRILEDGGYRTQEVQPVEMFAHTNHVESVAWLAKENGFI